MAEIAVFLLVGATMLGFGFVASRNRLGAWQEAAQSCGLQVVETSNGWKPRLRARSGLVYVRMEMSGDKGQSTLVTVEAPAPPEFHAVTIRPESSLELGREIEIGDQNFDDAFFIQGPARLVLALLDAKTRRLLVALKEKCGIVINSGELRAFVSGDEKVAAVLSLLLQVQKRFASNVLQRLAENANGDPEPGVRLQNLLLLIRELSWSPVTGEALRRACSDPVPEIRLRAAKQLGAEGRGVLLELAENLEDDTVSAEALMVLDRDLPFERLNAILGLAMRRRRLQTARVCLEAIGRRRAAAGVGLLVKVMEREHGELALAAARTLGEIGSPAAEPSLIQALQRDDADVRVAAAEALGRVGSAAAVLPLKEAAERSRLDRELRRATRQAIAEIKSRVQGASPGQLSLAGAEAGQLSLAGAEAGQLSLAQAEAGQLSLTEDPAGQLSLGDDE
ncbi:MAG TPA: HEAT repeat domain-containing protein [Thermoanaerobaculia bacterium]|nr:HEAT repeat domain-containing protein [Thermoanaerobaculia bacterium]